MDYVLITPARNEAAYIEKTIKSVCSQSVLPRKWVIVSDGSTDQTNEIVSVYEKQYSFIKLIQKKAEKGRNFGSKVRSINIGYKEVTNINYQFIGNLDADVTFDSDYYQKILGEFEKDKNLGIAGGIIQEHINGSYVSQNISLNSVAGAVQLFRRQCYERIGGYIPLENGGVDSAAEILARMHGWVVKTFPECRVLHHRRVATGRGNRIGTRFNMGITHYSLGYHPLFHIASCLSRIADRPFFIGSISSIAGYYWSQVRGYKKQLPPDAQKYLRSEQMGRLKTSLLHFKRE